MGFIYGLLVGLACGAVAGALFFRKNSATIAADLANVQDIKSKL